MHFKWMAILGVAAAMMTGQPAEAARGDRDPVARPHATRAAPIVLQSNSSRRTTVSTARGGHAPRAAARSTAGRDHFVSAARGRSGRVVAGQSRHLSGRPVAGRSVSGRSVVGRSVVGRSATRGHHASLLRPGYESAMLRGQGTRFSSSSMSACSTVRGRRVCGGTRTVAMRWSGGLAPAAGQQSSCPDGTMATLAVGHENVVRCVPM